MWGVALVAAAVAAFLRFYDIENNPPGLWQDEASTAVDAWLMWWTGHDRAGDHLPIISKSFGDYPFATYRYLAAPIVGLLGLTPGHERLVSSTASFLMVLGSAWLGYLVLGRRVALGTLLSAAICPTWILLARYGSEQILLPFCVVLGLCLVEVGRAPNRRYALWLGAFLLGASTYTYHAVKVFLPVWIVGYLVYLWPLLRALWADQRRHVLGPASVFAALALPSVAIALTPNGMARSRMALGLYSHHGWDLAFHTQRLYRSYWDPSVAYFEGSGVTGISVPTLGYWSWMDLPLQVVGFAVIFYALKHKAAKRGIYALLLYWFVIGPVPGAVGDQWQNMTRVIAWLPCPNLISGVGFAALLGLVAGDDAWPFTPPTPPGWLRARLLPAALTVGFALTAANCGYQMLISYPVVAQEAYQADIHRAMRCARELAERQQPPPQIIVAPQFAYASTFAMFHFLELSRTANGDQRWQEGNVDEVPANTLYVFPAAVPKPRGTALCTVIYEEDGLAPVSFVYGPPQPGPSLGAPL